MQTSHTGPRSTGWLGTTGRDGGQRERRRTRAVAPSTKAAFGRTRGGSWGHRSGPRGPGVPRRGVIGGGAGHIVGRLGGCADHLGRRASMTDGSGRGEERERPSHEGDEEHREQRDRRHEELQEAWRRNRPTGKERGTGRPNKGGYR